MTSPLHVCLAGSHDFVQRMNRTLIALEPPPPFTSAEVHSCSLAEVRSVVIEHRPQVLVFDIGLRAVQGDAGWLRQTLGSLRERLSKSIYIIAAATAPERFLIVGDLLFEDDYSLAPSCLIDGLIFSPPLNFPLAPSLETQIKDSVCCAAEVMGGTGKNPLPSLGDASWAPSFADPESRSVWLRWLPRYARYINENPLIVGETGSGKTKLAAALHELSGRKGPFVSITPRDFSSTELVQAELFGAVAGAYTGAVEKWGLVKKADRGTLFIDELQSIDHDLQGKLITFIENKTYRRVGEAESNCADVRFVFATNRSLQSLVRDGRLRDDFAYRLERLQLSLKPLHQRRLDIAAGLSVALAKVIRERHQGSTGRGAASDSRRAGPSGLSQTAYGRIFGAMWPGNLRQLENTIARLIEISSIKGKRVIDEECVEEALPGLLGNTAVTAADLLASAVETAQRLVLENRVQRLPEVVAQLESCARNRALETAGGDLGKAAALIGDSRKALEVFVTARSRHE